MNVFETIAEAIADRYECEVSDITPETTFQELGIDSLDTVEFLMELEETFDTELELEDKISTVGELVEFIEKKIA